MRDAWATTWLSKNGAYAFVAGTQHYLGEPGQRLHPVIRRNCGIGRQFSLKFATTSPSKRDVLGIAILIRGEG